MGKIFMTAVCVFVIQHQRNGFIVDDIDPVPDIRRKRFPDDGCRLESVVFHVGYIDE